MNFNVYIEDALGRQLDSIAQEQGQKRNAIIREALNEWLERHYPSAWPATVMQFKGEAEFPPFEASRNQLLPPEDKGIF